METALEKNIPGINPELHVINQLPYYKESLETNQTDRQNKNLCKKLKTS